MPENHGFAGQSLFGRGDALVHGAIGHRKIVVERACARCACSRHFICRLQPLTPCGARDGDVESISAGSSRIARLAFLSAQRHPTGMLKPAACFQGLPGLFSPIAYSIRCPAFPRDSNSGPTETPADCTGTENCRTCTRPYASAQTPQFPFLADTIFGRSANYELPTTNYDL